MSQAAGATVFLDRDGTLIWDVDYLCRVEQIRIVAASSGSAGSVTRIWS